MTSRLVQLLTASATMATRTNTCDDWLRYDASMRLDVAFSMMSARGKGLDRCAGRTSFNSTRSSADTERILWCRERLWRMTDSYNASPWHTEKQCMVSMTIIILYHIISYTRCVILAIRYLWKRWYTVSGVITCGVRSYRSDTHVSARSGCCVSLSDLSDESEQNAGEVGICMHHHDLWRTDASDWLTQPACSVACEL